MHCKPCNDAHVHLNDLLWEFGEKLRIKLRFAHSSKATLYMLAHAEQRPNEIMDILEAWHYRKDDTHWENTYKTDYNASIAQSLAQQLAWAADNDTKGTPAFFVDGRPLPVPFTIDDAKHYFRNAIDA